MRQEDIRIEIAKNTCAGCGKEYDQPALVSQFLKLKAIENQLATNKIFFN